jgi:hypothetical protein
MDREDMNLLYLCVPAATEAEESTYLSGLRVALLDKEERDAT